MPKADRHSSSLLKAPFSLCVEALNPLKPTAAIWAQLAIKHTVPDRVKPSFVIFDIRAL